MIDLPPDLAPVPEVLAKGLGEVASLFDAHLRSDLLPVADLVAHVERYRGKMLRPALALLCGLASSEQRPALALSRAHYTIAATCEMVHMATLVHDDVLDEAEVRRRGRTINALQGNEAAVMLGDYLIAGAFHLCSLLDDPRPARTIGSVSMAMCAGELLQLSNRENLSLDLGTYLEILERKTGALIGAACELGALASGAPVTTADALRRYGLLLGVAFQVQDDLLDLLGDERTVGKSVGRDAGKGKITLPMILALREAPPDARIAIIAAYDAARAEPTGDAPRRLAALLDECSAVEHSRAFAAGHVDRALTELNALKPGPAREALRLLGRAVINRAF
ncbi:MAG: polyprenyl synthetase family protein [Phycisphaerales bacterium]|nr:polyprenyl synthetase family protein [Phycisphaerales bacterium]